MSLISGPIKKHKLEGIGSASAAMVLASFASNPSLSFLTLNMSGKILFWVLTKFFSAMASLGLVVLNVGAEKLLTALDKVNYDGSWESADKMMAEIRKTGRDLTPQETKTIDDEVIKSFRKFAKFGRKKK